MIGVVVSESGIVAKAIIKSIESSFTNVRYFVRFGDLPLDVDPTDCVFIYDVGKPAEDIEALLRFIRRSGSCRVVVLTKETHDLREFEPLVGHVSAILPFSSGLEEIALVARLVRPDFFLLPSAMVSILQTPKIRVTTPDAAMSSLTGREVSVLAFIAEGASNKVIARKLGINDTTVRVHVRSVLRKIGVNNRTQAALFVMQNQKVLTS